MRNLALVALLSISCATKSNAPAGAGGATIAAGGAGTGGARSSSGGNGGSVGGDVDVGAGGSLPKPEPKYHPPPGFESCKHAEVKTDCSEGWCKLPPSCFVMGSPEDEWYRGKNDEVRTAVTLTHQVEVQQKEMTRAEWESITKTSAPGPVACDKEDCPVAMVSWWDAIQAADLLSDQKGKARCYEPQDCRGTLGRDFTCAKVKDPTKSLYNCAGYRLLTRTEAEYASRAGTISTFYSGDITEYPDTDCRVDPAVELVGWYCNNSGGHPHVGGGLAPNGFGLFDTVGNVLEWRNDELDYSSSPGGADPRGTVGTDSNRTFSLGQYDGQAVIARTAGFGTGPWDTRGNQGGFRLVRTLDPKP